MVYTSKDKTRELFVRDGLSQSDPSKPSSHYGNQMSNYSPQQRINSQNRNYYDQNQENDVYKKVFRNLLHHLTGVSLQEIFAS